MTSEEVAAVAKRLTKAQQEEAAAFGVLRRLAFQHGGQQPWMDASTASMRMGEQDDHPEVQSYARHRLATQPAPTADALREAARQLMEAVELHGDWDDGCFYYNKRAASELERPLVRLRAALASPEPTGTSHD